MKRNLIITISAVVTLCIWFFLRNPPDRSQEARSAEQQSFGSERKILRIRQNSEAAEQRRKSEDPQGLAAIEEELGRPLTTDEILLKPDEVDWLKWYSFLRLHAIKSFNNKDIEVYGRLVDRSGNPISGVKVSGYIHYYVESLAEAVERRMDKKEWSKDVPFERVTDENGIFSITEGRGSNLTVLSEKEGAWKFPGRKNNESFNFNDSPSRVYQPDPNNPKELIVERVIDN